MAKSYNNIFNEIVNYNNLELALHKTISGRNLEKNPEHFEYFLRKEYNIGKLLNDLESDLWIPSKPRTFRLFLPKQRDIKAPQFLDRIVHHSLNNIIEEKITNKFIHHSYACIKGKGSQRAVIAVQKMMRSYSSIYSNPYIVQIDIYLNTLII